MVQYFLGDPRYLKHSKARPGAEMGSQLVLSWHFMVHRISSLGKLPGRTSKKLWVEQSLTGHFVHFSDRGSPRGHQLLWWDATALPAAASCWPPQRHAPGVGVPSHRWPSLGRPQENPGVSWCFNMLKPHFRSKNCMVGNQTRLSDTDVQKIHDFFRLFLDKTTL